MTPDQARALLDGTTPGPWEVNPRHPGDGLPPDEVARAQADAALIAAAPALAAMIAGMREEWGVYAEGTDTAEEFTEWGFDTEDGAHAWESEARPPGHGPATIVRRYVTNEEDV